MVCRARPHAMPPACAAVDQEFVALARRPMGETTATTAIIVRPLSAGRVAVRTASGHSDGAIDGVVGAVQIGRAHV